jgi:putative membrane protein
MTSINIGFSAVAALLHVVFFLLESVFFMSPQVHRAFGVKNLKDAELLRVPMFNQGFYNLFLAIGVFEGIYLYHQGYVPAGITLILFSCASMFIASLVLLISKKGMLRGVLIQGACPLMAILSYYFGW